LRYEFFDQVNVPPKISSKFMPTPLARGGIGVLPYDLKSCHSATPVTGVVQIWTYRSVFREYSPEGKSGLSL
jgi:hypothetical protein